ncbi:flavin reductase [Arthrobacter koreensis]|uniref:Flavin reductase n=1 Tax=Arthrobacter koreensis TaxID=199136 RepID=A0ABY6FSY3_9MICC|nr:flavin reductase [Arthrobacter koreensis]UYB35849.1 flavin reductase [Arthrobacter koreensis]
MNTQDLLPIPGFDQDMFRRVVGHFASGVTVITTSHDGRLYGTTASAVSSLSMDPPMMLMCLNRSSSTHDAVRAAGIYVINILADHQEDLALRFGRKGADKFSGVGYTVSEHGGVPVLEDVLATITCVVTEAPQGGSHTVFFGQVVDARAASGNPLAYYRGAFGRLESVRELDTYRKVRRWVLSRSTPSGGELEIHNLVTALGAEPDDVFNSLVKLTTEGLVSRSDSGAFQVTPITAELSDGLYEGRAMIEAGVIASRAQGFDEGLLETLLQLTKDMEGIRCSADGSLRDFLELHSRFHQSLVRASGSSQLFESYRRLSIAGVWTEAWDDTDWRDLLDHAELSRLAEALRTGETDAAIDAVRAYTEQAKHFARLAIASRGGAV